MINQNTVAKVEEILQGHCYAPMKEAAEKWLEAAKAGDDTAAAALEENFIAQLKDSVATADEIIELFGSEAGIAKFGADLAAQIKGHGEELKAAGKKYCDCPACCKALEILGDFSVEM